MTLRIILDRIIVFCTCCNTNAVIVPGVKDVIDKIGE